MHLQRLCHHWQRLSDVVMSLEWLLFLLSCSGRLLLLLVPITVVEAFRLVSAFIVLRQVWLKVPKHYAKMNSPHLEKCSLNTGLFQAMFFLGSRGA